jgi:mono/diheme cytochrome c family protein
LKALIALALLCLMPLAAGAQEPVPAGRGTFENHCSGCHGADGNGGELGPAIAWRLAALSDTELQSTILGGLPGRGMPANNVSSADLPPLIAYLRTQGAAGQRPGTRRHAGRREFRGRAVAYR